MSEFESKLKELINMYSIENGSNTPDFLLADYLMGCLKNYEKSVNARDQFRGLGKNDSVQLTVELPDWLASKIEEDLGPYGLTQAEVVLGILESHYAERDLSDDDIDLINQIMPGEYKTDGETD